MKSMVSENLKFKPIKLSRAEKILLVLYKLSQGSRKNVRYEDIVVAAFKKYPEDFQLRGYPQYPDSGDLVHKPLYDFRKKGLLEANNKVFTLTERGFSVADKLKKIIAGRSVVSEGKLSRYAKEETERIISLEGFQLFRAGEESKITDTDLYNYLGVTVRTSRNDFLGRWKTVSDAVKEIKSIKWLDSVRVQIPRYHEFLIEKFKHILEFKSK
ncbi:MAG: hypothetical protein CO014_00220 [Candidatus Tagabacteria bacterium CG_4_8_14_3_um_filter_41_8]|uniref:Uncharacterized protein n=1 Tax=Candidatus Tagabacteria bacterium CG_4_8_14_3_um_filter_41_8 TaxID=1975018 RepID=A0A2M8G9L0_9BACT|nr:MAG: hypothetical protein CO014_00220 [Candidatus Tagabacteria bacterium CG_4_8_14_3_um_filter_41_8]